MILLEVANGVVAEAIRSRIKAAAAGKPKEIEVTVADFDGVLFHISNPGGDKGKVMVSVKMAYFHELKAFGVDDLMKREYGDMLVAAEGGQDVSVVVDLDAIVKDLPGGGGPLDDRVEALLAKVEPVIQKVALLKRNCFAAVFEHYFKAQKAGGSTGKPAVINYRPEESMYVDAQKDRVTVIFSVLFSDADDVVIGKVFLQEFKEGRRGNSQAPQVLFSLRDPPAELQGTGARSGDNISYVTLVLFARHLEDKVAQQTIDLVQTFRNYLHYHIKCSKAYLHQRMRARTESLLKVLNRARPDSDSKEKKTASGKTFTRN